jgi:hypothetical protein
MGKQRMKPKLPPPSASVARCEWEKGTREVYYRGERIAFIELKEPTRKTAPPIPIPPSPRVTVGRKPKKDHPWHQGWQNMKPWLPHRSTAAPSVGIRTYLRFALNRRVSLQRVFQREHENPKRGHFSELCRLPRTVYSARCDADVVM